MTCECEAGSKAAPETTWAFLHWSLHPENQLQVASQFSQQQQRPFSSCKRNILSHVKSDGTSEKSWHESLPRVHWSPVNEASWKLAAYYNLYTHKELGVMDTDRTGMLDAVSIVFAHRKSSRNVRKGTHLARWHMLLVITKTRHTVQSDYCFHPNRQGDVNLFFC